MHEIKSRRYWRILKQFGPVLLIASVLIVPSAAAFAGKICGGGNGEPTVTTVVDIGCTNQGNPITDVTFAIIRFLSAGAGLVIVGSLVYAGIMYSMSAGDPQAAARAMGRIRASVIALMIFIFGYALLNYLVPGGFLH